MKRIDLNCDMGESFGPWKMGQDVEVIPHISSANIACGGHAGDPSVMAATVGLAKAHGVAVGAHPGFEDLQGFGRRPMMLTADEIVNVVLYQIGALWAFVKAAGMDLHHVKPHGALYNMACAERPVARPVVEAVRRFSPALPLYCLPASFLESECIEQGLTPVMEGFVDRAYEPNGLLADRKQIGAVSSDPIIAAERATELAAGHVTCNDGSMLDLHVSTLCVHGDTPGAPRIAAAVRAALTEAGYAVSSVLRSS